VSATTTKIAASCSREAARASDSTSSGLSTEKSPDLEIVTSSASSAGCWRSILRFARFMTPCSSTRIFWIERRDHRPHDSHQGLSARDSRQRGSLRAARTPVAASITRRHGCTRNG
jgi:hypothetical protein